MVHRTRGSKFRVLFRKWSPLKGDGGDLAEENHCWQKEIRTQMLVKNLLVKTQIWKWRLCSPTELEFPRCICGEPALVDALPSFGTLELSDCCLPGSLGRPHSSGTSDVLSASVTKEKQRSWQVELCSETLRAFWGKRPLSRTNGTLGA